MGEIDPVRFVTDRFEHRNAVSRRFFAAEAERLALASKSMAARFQEGGRLLAFGRGAWATDAQHVSVEFVHPVIVGKRALPALDLSAGFAAWLPALLRATDMVMGFGPPEGDPEVDAALAMAAARGAMTFALPGGDAGAGGYAVAPPSAEPYVQQEMFEILYHTLWETVHVFFEHREHGHDVGESSFLYPFLGSQKQDTGAVVAEVAASIRSKATDDESLRDEVAAEQAGAIAATALAIRDRVEIGGTLLLFGNGGSATDANDWALDCVTPHGGRSAIPAISLAMEPANLSAVANDIGPEAMFLRQLIAQARATDVAIGISTSGGSANVIAALEEARRRGLLTVALLGYDGGEIGRRGLVDHPLLVRCDYIPRIQEIQASIYHVILELLGERNLAERPSVPIAVTADAAAGRAGVGARAGLADERGDPRPGGSASSLELFGSAGCPFTAELREHLLLGGEEFVEHDVELDAAAFRRLLALSPGEARVPVLVDAGAVRQVGWQGRSCPAPAPPGVRRGAAVPPVDERT